MDFTTVIAPIIRVVLLVIGVFSMVLFLLGTFKLMTSSGNNDKAKAAQWQIFSAVFGLIVIFATFLFVRFVLDQSLLAV